MKYKEILNESTADLLRRQYPGFSNLSKQGDNVYDLILNVDPTKRKYHAKTIAGWFNDLTPENFERVISNVEYLKDLTDAFVYYDANRDKLTGHDLAQAKEGPDDFIRIMYEVRKAKGDGTVAPTDHSANVLDSISQYENDGEIAVIYTDDKIIIIQTLTYSSNVFFGVGSSWCTSSRGSGDIYFKMYSAGEIYQILIKANPAAKYQIAVNEDGTIREVADINNEHDFRIPQQLYKKYPGVYADHALGDAMRDAYMGSLEKTTPAISNVIEKLNHTTTNSYGLEVTFAVDVDAEEIHVQSDIGNKVLSFAPLERAIKSNNFTSEKYLIKYEEELLANGLVISTTLSNCSRGNLMDMIPGTPIYGDDQVIISDNTSDDVLMNMLEVFAEELVHLHTRSSLLDDKTFSKKIFELLQTDTKLDIYIGSNNVCGIPSSKIIFTNKPVLEMLIPTTFTIKVNFGDDDYKLIVQEANAAYLMDERSKRITNDKLAQSEHIPVTLEYDLGAIPTHNNSDGFTDMYIKIIEIIHQYKRRKIKTYRVNTDNLAEITALEDAFKNPVSKGNK